MTTTWPEKRALTVSLVGLVFQVAQTTVLLLLSLWTHSQATRAAALLASGGILIWMLLALIYKQRRLVREEAFEAEQLRREREASGAGSALFGGQEEQFLLARRRLIWMHRWLVPLFTIAIIAQLVISALAYWSWSLGTALRDRSWALPSNAAVAAAFAAGTAFLAFLLSRYLTGMGRQADWRLLRAGAAYLMGNTLACAALAATLGLVYFQMYVPERAVAHAIRLLMLVLSVEFLLKFVLDFYRPRRPDDEPHLAFDSRLLGLFCEPGGIARSIAEAINYQFGFEVSSTWFYKLMQRAAAPVLCFGVLTMFAISSVVIVDTGEMVVIERFGRPLQSGAATETVRDVRTIAVVDALGPGLHFKWPWPIDIAYRYPVGRVQEAMIGFRQEAKGEGSGLDKPILWTKKHEWEPHLDVIVATETGTAAQPAVTVPSTQPAVADRSVPVSLIRVSMPVEYRIVDLKAWRERYVDPQKLFEELAYRELTKYCASVDVDQAMGADRMKMAEDLRQRVQAKADALGLGVQIVFLGVRSVHPPEEVAKDFEALVGAQLNKRTVVLEAETERKKRLSEVCGDVQRAHELVEAITRLNSPSVSAEERAALQRRLEAMFTGEGGTGVPAVTGEAAQVVLQARAEMWKKINEARADAEVFVQELAVYRSAPRIYKMRKYTEVLRDGLKDVRKYLVAADIDPVYHLQLMDPVVTDMARILGGQGGKP